MDTFDYDGANGHSQRNGHWVTEGGRLRWVPAGEAQVSIDEALGLGHAADVGPETAASDDAEVWASDSPPLPPGAPESYRVRAAQAWLERKRDTERAIADEFAGIERERLRQRDAEETPQRRRRQPPEPMSPAAVEMAQHDAAAEWYDLARDQLRDFVEQSSGRALVEWYLWLQAEPPLDTPDPSDALGNARFAGDATARELTLHHAERLALPDLEED